MTNMVLIVIFKKENNFLFPYTCLEKLTAKGFPKAPLSQGKFRGSL